MAMRERPVARDALEGVELRQAYRLAVVGVTHNPVIRASAGKSKMNALGHCLAKALSLVWGVWRNGADWDPHWGSGT